MKVKYLELADFWVMAEMVTGIDSQTLSTASRADMAGSALHAPMASFGGTEAYPSFIDKAALLLVRMTKNHPLLDGNKRATWVSRRIFMATSGYRWGTSPSVDDAENEMQAIASGEWAEKDSAEWLVTLFEGPDDDNGENHQA